MVPRTAWHLRSYGDQDTHLGEYSDVTRSVHALCGVEFLPRPLAGGQIALPGEPADPRQVCPQCRRARR